MCMYYRCVCMEEDGEEGEREGGKKGGKREERVSV